MLIDSFGSVESINFYDVAIIILIFTTQRYLGLFRAKNKQF